jgi:hypothetical protein
MNNRVEKTYQSDEEIVNGSEGGRSESISEYSSSEERPRKRDSSGNSITSTPRGQLISSRPEDFRGILDANLQSLNRGQRSGSNQNQFSAKGNDTLETGNFDGVTPGERYNPGSHDEVEDTVNLQDKRKSHRTKRHRKSKSHSRSKIVKGRFYSIAHNYLSQKPGKDVDDNKVKAVTLSMQPLGTLQKEHELPTNSTDMLGLMQWDRSTKTLLNGIGKTYGIFTTGIVIFQSSNAKRILQHIWRISIFHLALNLQMLNWTNTILIYASRMRIHQSETIIIYRV